MRIRLPHYRPGDHLVVCDRSGRTCYRSECRLEWNGLLVHQEEFETRHPQDLIKGRRDNTRVRDARPRGTDYFLSPGEITRANLDSFSIPGSAAPAPPSTPTTTPTPIPTPVPTPAPEPDEPDPVTPTPVELDVAPTNIVPTEITLNPNLPPSGNFNLSQWYLTLPNNDTVDPSVLVTGYELADTFYSDPETGGMTLKCPNIASHTENSSYSRTELRELLNPITYSGYKADKNNWVSSLSSAAKRAASGAVDGTLWARVRVDHVSATGLASKYGRVVIGQIHGQDTDTVCRLIYHKRPNDAKGALYFGQTYPGQDSNFYYDVIGGPDHLNPSNGVALGEKFVYRLSLVGSLLSVSIYRTNQATVTTTVTLPSFYVNRYMYFKAGCYNQNNTGTDYAQITFFNLENQHPLLRYQDRDYLLYLPFVNYHRLLIVLHGGLGNAGSVRAQLDELDKIAEKRGWIVAYLNGTDTATAGLKTWNAGEGYFGIAGQQNLNDTGYVNGFITYLKGKYNIPANRVYLIGHSNGAMLAYKFVTDLPNVVSAIVPISGALLPAQFNAGTVKIKHIHGSADTNVPIAGGAGSGVTDGVTFRSLADTETALEANGAQFDVSIVQGAAHSIDSLNTVLATQNLSLEKMIETFILGL